MSTEQHIGPSSIVTKAGVGVDGPGYLAGEHPAGRTTVNGTPVSADVDVFYELDTKDWQRVASTTSQPDGTWSIVGLNPDKKFNVVARHASFGGVIAVDVQPSRTDVVTLSGAFTTNDDFDGVDGFMTIESGIPPFTASVVDPLPYGLLPVIDGRELIIDGTSTDSGTWESTVRVSDSNGTFADVAVDVTIQAAEDPYWGNVVARMEFDDALLPWKDVTGKLWSESGGAITDPTTFKFGGRSAKFSSSARVVCTDPNLDLGLGDFTVDFWWRPQAAFNDAAITINGLLIYTADGSYYCYHSAVGNFMPITGVDISEFSLFSLQRRSGQFEMYINGVKRAMDTTSLSLSSGGVAIGYFGPGNPGRGWIDDLRITKGVARYTANFAPPTEPFPIR